MSADRSQITSVSLLALTSSVSMFSTFLPEFREVRKSKGEPSFVNDVRMGEVAAVGLTLAIGISASALTNSPVPAGAAVVAALTLVIMYESVLKLPPKENA